VNRQAVDTASESGPAVKRAALLLRIGSPPHCIRDGLELVCRLKLADSVHALMSEQSKYLRRIVSKRAKLCLDEHSAVEF
jgi:hypothetical protein